MRYYHYTMASRAALMTFSHFYRTLVYLEGDASMRSYEDAEGRKQTSLSLVQRTSYIPYHTRYHPTYTHPLPGMR